ncbi:Hypothetical protein SSA_2081 [Streptococcus sanguinis SK36]|uniref:Uncharacterized protein n=1 Tax=Streptococcus sanguinis (strain SK36) TaxID=388919 RepID=A3CQJ8_STRSV|nr:Hypothetical protein SSA_2081 [Streptococcus sanguinis SK36]
MSSVADKALPKQAPWLQANFGKRDISFGKAHVP